MFQAFSATQRHEQALARTAVLQVGVVEAPTHYRLRVTSRFLEGVGPRCYGFQVAKKIPPGESLKLELDGPGVRPDNVDTRATLELALAYVSALERVAQQQLGGKLEFTGLWVEDKCAAVKIFPSDVQLAKSTCHETSRFVAGVVRPPVGIIGVIDRVRKAIRALPKEQVATVIIGPWRKRLQVGQAEDLPWPATRTSMRVYVERVGGSEPGARLRSRTEQMPFLVKLDKGQARDLAAHLYRWIDAGVRLRRDADGRISEADLIDHQALQEGNAAQAWFEWLRDNGREWDDFEDALEELSNE